ncbi:zinc metalloproteinase nas-28-like [Manduca sexta]|uniref:zinc metalloproteinase nas-28-like n=1 Tax=Manduca sexta TaxID=7130 RepID=UPI001890759A|nr:zinc metalloproteinase nas-28-like [Manduca sexta]
MVRSALQKCSIVICYFMMCPRRTNFATPPIQKLKPEIIPIQNDVIQFDSASDDIESIVKVKNVETTKDEPGFDLTDEEIVKFNIWPQGVIPYYIDVYSYNDKVLRDKIRGFLNTVSSITSLNFLELPSPPKDEESKWVFFLNRRGLLGCSDHSTKNFTNKGVQKVTLGYDCMSTGGELAEAVLAIAGVPPQHNAPDRDKYIRVVEQNIMPDKRHLFTKLNNNEWLFHDIEYDFASVSHYHSHKYSLNGQATIEMQENYEEYSIGESYTFSAKDILKIKMLYNFITKKKHNISECHKLFEPGSNFNRYKPDKVAISPRKKPNKYTGKSNAIEKDNKTKHRLTGPQKSEIEETLSADDIPSSIQEDLEVTTNNPDESGDENLSTKNLTSLKNQLKYRGDPLTYLSDYKSSAEYTQQLKLQSKNELAFIKPGDKNKNSQKIIKKKIRG